MRQVVVFAGTTEGRKICEWLAAEGVETLVCVATEYGQELLEERDFCEVRMGRMTREEMAFLLEQEGRPLVLDVTHPYAVEVSENIREACETSGSEYLRLIRPSNPYREEDCVCVASVEEAVQYLERTKGRIFVATGSKELHRFTGLSNYQERVYARVLATPEVVRHCTELGFLGAHLICMQGPFSKELNLAMLKQTGASFLVTKESGRAGGFEEKLEAAREAGARVVLIGRPPEQEGMSIEEGIFFLQKRFGLKGTPLPHRHEDCWDAGSRSARSQSAPARKAVLAGIGMGVPENMTLEAQRAFADADCILGAGRMLDAVKVLGKPVFDAYDPGKMLAWLKEHPEYRKVAVALSGDVGFYSGAKRLTTAFEEAGFSVDLIPGISSVVYLCSRLKISWENVRLLSVHGRQENLVAAVHRNLRTFTLLGGADGVRLLCEQLLEYGLAGVHLIIGEWLHYPEERIQSGTPRELMEETFDGLCVALIENPDYVSGTWSCIPDEKFLRGNAPMTKSELRCLSVAKLRLRRDSVVYDIGAGTGSVSVEAALQVDEGCVWAIEKKKDAAELIRENSRRFGVPQVQVVEGSAPEALLDLPAPTHAFVGGSSGNMKEILELLLTKNPRVRVVINAVTLETMAEAGRCMKELAFEDVEIVQVQVARAKAVGSYQMMMGQNPVYIFSGQGAGKKDGEDMNETA